jgi:hypothetical protein
VRAPTSAQSVSPDALRRNLVEHAAAGGVLDERILTAGFLPFVDAGRLRALTAWGASVGDAGPVLRVWRRAAHRYRRAIGDVAP